MNYSSVPRSKKRGIIKKRNFKILSSVILAGIVFAVIYVLWCSKAIIPCSVSGLIAIFIALFSISYTIQYRKYVAGNIFLITWEIGFSLSLFKLSNRQFVYDEIICFYFLIIGLVPLLIEKLVFYKRKGKYFREDTELQKPMLIAYLFLVMSVLFFLLVLRKYGIYATQGERISIADNGSWMNVACVVFTRMSYYIAAYYYITKNNKKVIPIVLWSVVYCLVTMTRSLLISFAIYFIILFIVYKKIRIYRLIIGALVIIVVFGVLGNLREGTSFSIAEYSGVEGNSIFGWLYSYLCVNFDNLALQIQSGKPTYTLSYLLRPIITLFDLNYNWFDVSYLYVGHLNLGTFYRDYVCDLGEYAMIPFSATIIILLLIIYSRNKGGYISISKFVIMSELALSPLTNHFTQSPVWIVILFCFGMQIATNIFLKRKKASII